LPQDTSLDELADHSLGASIGYVEQLTHLGNGQNWSIQFWCWRN
jgi:hypothetical protein